MSALERILECSAAGHLPREDTTNAAAQFGTAMHKWKETGVWPKGRAFERRRRNLEAAGITREMLWQPELGRHEVPVAIRTPSNTARTPKGIVDGDAWKALQPPDAVTGTIDWLGTLLFDLHVDDLKTGTWVPSNPLDLVQMQGYATAALLLHPDADSVLVSITHWPRSPADSLPRQRFSPEPWTRKDANEFLHQVERARRDVIASRDFGPHAITGPHCQYCAVVECPAYGDDDDA